MEAKLHFVLANVLLLFASASAGYLAMRGREPWRKALAVAAAYPALITVVTLLLGVAGLLTARWGTAASGIAAVALGVPAYRALRAGGSAGAPQEHRRLEDADRLLLALSGGLLATMAALYVGYVLTSGCILKPDDLSYHAVQPAHWIVHQRLTLGFGTYQSYYPHGSELLALWLMLPFRSDGMVGFAALVWLAVAVLAITGIGRSLGAPRGASLLPAVVFLASAPVLRRLNTFSATDLAAPAAALAALAFLALPVRRARDGKAHTLGWRDVVCAGLCCGLAFGAKASMLPLAAILAVWLVWRVAREETTGVALGKAGALTLASLVTGGYWYIRNAVLTGNPLFPVAVGPLAGPFGPEDQAPSKLSTWFADPPPGTDWGVLGDYVFDWPVGLFALSVIGYTAGLAWLGRGNVESEPKGDRGLGGLLLFVGAALALAFPFSPFSATSEWPGAPLQAQARYVLLSYLVGVALLGRSFAGQGPNARLWAALVLLMATAAFAATVSASGGEAPRALTLALLAIGGAGALSTASWRGGTAWRPGRLAAATAVVLALLAVLQPVKAGRADAGFPAAVTGADTAAPPRDMAPLIQALEELPEGSRVAWFQPNPSFCYWAFGRRLQLDPVLVDADGNPRPPLHRLWRDGADQPWWTLAGSVAEPPTEPDLVVARLREAGVEWVVITRWRGDEGPPQRAAVAEAQEVEKVHEDGVSALWRL